MLKLLVLFAVIFCCGHYFENRLESMNASGDISHNISSDNSSVKTDEHIVYSKKQNEIYKQLEEMAENNSEYFSIYKHREEYPLDLLNSLVQNEEMLEFVTGYFDADKKPKGRLTDDELNSKSPLLIQWDKRWGYANYGNDLMAIAGCGPTCLSMAVVDLTGNINATPYEVAKFSVDNGYYVKGNGTKWTLFSEGVKEYGLISKELPLHEPSFKNALDNGKILVLVMGPGNFTSSGHYIVIYGYNENGFYVNDPNSYKKSEKVWSYSEFSDEIRNIWALSEN